MAHRAYWKGFLRLSLVSSEVYNAVDTTSEISFRQIHKPSGRRINYTKTVQSIGEVNSADIVKGYEVGDDTYVTLEPEEPPAKRRCPNGRARVGRPVFWVSPWITNRCVTKWPK